MGLDVIMENLGLVEGTRNGVDFGQLLSKLGTEIGFEFSALASIDPACGTMEIVTTFPKDWVSHYFKNNLVRKDPVYLKAARGLAPVQWNRMSGHEGYDEVYGSAADYGISDLGLTIPIRGSLGEISMLSVSGSMSKSEFAALLEAKMSHLQRSAAILHESFTQKMSPMKASLGNPLSVLERDVLQWAALGLDCEDISHRAGISERMVCIVLGSIRVKLRVRTTAQAIGRALVRKIITPH